MSHINATLIGISLICSTALAIRLSMSGPRRGRVWVLLLIVFMLRFVAKVAGL